MVNEHYVQQSYLRLFAPEKEGVVSRYSLVEKHGGGDYFDPIERYSIENAASTEGYADELLESGVTSKAEKAIVNTFRKVDDNQSLSKEDIANLSQFVSFQRDRSPASKMHHRMVEELFRTVNYEVEDYWEGVMHMDGNERYTGFQHLGWKVVENQTQLPFFTSDVPVFVYQDEFPEDEGEGFQFDGKQIFCPITPDKLLVLLDPSMFKVEPQYPETEIDTVRVKDRREVWKYNLLQGIGAFQEVFGPVGAGKKLQQMIEVMCRHFPDEDYIRGHRWSTERIQQAQRQGIRESHQCPHQNTIPPEDKRIIISCKKATEARWLYDHKISLINDLRLEKPIPNYW